MAPSQLKETFKMASHAFILRDNAASLAHLDQLFALLPPPPLRTWAVDLPPKTRLQERWRNQAAALFLTVSTVEFKARRDQKGSTSTQEGGDTETFVKSLLDKMSSLYRPLCQQQHEPLVPPNVVSTLVMSSRSLGIHSSSTKTMLESYMASLPSEILDTLAAHPLSSSSASPWWPKEALEGYEALLEMYLVDVLAGGDGAGEGEREEAKRLLEWNGVVGEAGKQRILALLDSPTPSTPPNHPILLPPCIETSLTSLPDLPISPPHTPLKDSPTTSSERELDASSALLPSTVVASPRPTTPLPVVTHSPPRPPTPSYRALAITQNLLRPYQSALASSVPPLLAFVVFFALRRRDSPLLKIKVWRKWILWFLRTAWRDIRFTWALATSITYV